MEWWSEPVVAARIVNSEALPRRRSYIVGKTRSQQCFSLIVELNEGQCEAFKEIIVKLKESCLGNGWRKTETK
eukprot:6600050-Alexandrium_andersonii.AAC.1